MILDPIRRVGARVRAGSFRRNGPMIVPRSGPCKPGAPTLVGPGGRGQLGGRSRRTRRKLQVDEVWSFRNPSLVYDKGQGQIWPVDLLLFVQPSV